MIKNFCRPPAVIVSYFSAYNTSAAHKADKRQDWLHEINPLPLKLSATDYVDRPKEHCTYGFALIRYTDMVKVQQFQNICMKLVKIEKQAKGRKSNRYYDPGKRGDYLTNVTF